jgi:hypothetical protein
VALADVIPGMRAILSVNLLKNFGKSHKIGKIGIDQANALVSILKEHPTLKSLCGNKGDETELAMSGKMNGPEDAIMLAAEIVDNGAMTSLNLSSNSIGGYQNVRIMVATPEGTLVVTAVSLLLTLCFL